MGSSLSNPCSGTHANAWTVDAESPAWGMRVENLTTRGSRGAHGESAGARRQSSRFGQEPKAKVPGFAAGRGGVRPGVSSHTESMDTLAAEDCLGG